MSEYIFKKRTLVGSYIYQVGQRLAESDKPHAAKLLKRGDICEEKDYPKPTFKPQYEQQSAPLPDVDEQVVEPPKPKRRRRTRKK